MTTNGELTASNKRGFLALAFLPFGEEVAHSLGMVPVSADVRERQNIDASHVLSTLLANNEEWVEALTSTARWYVEGMHQLPAHEETPLEAHLVNYFLAAFVTTVLTTGMLGTIAGGGT